MLFKQGLLSDDQDMGLGSVWLDIGSGHTWDLKRQDPMYPPIIELTLVDNLNGYVTCPLCDCRQTFLL